MAMDEFVKQTIIKLSSRITANLIYNVGCRLLILCKVIYILIKYKF